jgi:chromosome segregation ATPase
MTQDLAIALASVDSGEQERKTMENEITEQNMREYFERIISHVVGLSEQARKVEDLTQRVNDMASRITGLENENYNLKSDLQSQIERANQVQAQNDATQLELQNAREHGHALAETIVMRDSRVSELEQARQHAVDEASDLRHELSVAGNRIGDLEALVSDLRSQLDAVTEDRNNWQHAAHENERLAQDLRVQLDRIQSILNPVRPVETSAEPTVVDFASQTQDVA